MIRAALIGLGNIAWKYDARLPDDAFALSQGKALRRHPDTELVGGCSPSSEDREAFTRSSRLPAFVSAEAMLEALHPELVGICSPTELHFDHACLCLEAGVRLLWLEKPPTATPDELDALIALAEQKQATVCVNYFRRYLSVYRNLRVVIREEVLGPCHLLRLLYSPGLARNGVHLLDQIFFLTGGDAYELLWVERGRPEHPCFSLRLSTGQTVQADSADLAYHTNDISAVCAKGVASVLRGGKRAVVERRVENALFHGFYDLEDAGEEILGIASLEGYMDNSLADMVAAFAAGRRPHSDLHSARLTQRLLRDILEAAR